VLTSRVLLDEERMAEKTDKKIEYIWDGGGTKCQTKNRGGLDISMKQNQTTEKRQGSL